VTSGALTRFRVMAYVTGVVLASGCLVGLGFWPWYVGEGPAGVLWTAHGWLYVLYVVAAFHLAYRLRWRPVRTVLVLLAGTVPFMSFVAERRVVHDLRRAARSEAAPAPAPRA
jgi:integral membrane protein